ncbi:MAG: GMC family oxidoreductase [Verrucomicrobiota bacterium]
MEEFDAVIIGSGAGGSPVAWELVRAGKSVLVLEKVPRLRTQEDNGPQGLSDFKRDEMFSAGPEKIITLDGVANKGRSFFTSHIEPDLNDEPHLHSRTVEEAPVVTIEGYTAQCVGGGTQLYGAVSLRFTPDDFRLQSFNAGRSGLPGLDPNDPSVSIRDWPITYAELEPFYGKAERLVGINGQAQGQLKPFPGGSFYQTPLAPNPISQFAFDGITALGAVPYRTPLAVITEDHAPSGRKAGDPKTSYVNRYGDPLGYKSNTWVSLLRPTLREFPGLLQLRCNSVVTHLESSGSKVTVVHYRGPDGAKKTVTGKVVVVACSAIESIRLLMLSAEENRGGFGKLVKFEESGSLLGRYFLTHCFGGAETRVPDRFDKSISLDSDWATDFAASAEFILANKLWAGGAVYNNTSDQALPLSFVRTHMSTDLDTLWKGFAEFDPGLYGERIIEWLDNDFGRRLSCSFMANQIPWFNNHIRLSNVRDKWNRKSAQIVKRWHPHDGEVMNTLANVCKQILEKGTGTSANIEFGSVYGESRDASVRIANHILGGARFGNAENDSVLDRFCRLWGSDNLYVTDGSFMPTSGGANPTLTIQANAFRVGEHLAQNVL